MASGYKRYGFNVDFFLLLFMMKCFYVRNTGIVITIFFINETSTDDSQEQTNSLKFLRVKRAIFKKKLYFLPEQKLSLCRCCVNNIEKWL